MKKTITLVTGLVCLLWGLHAQPVLLKDLNTLTTGSSSLYTASPYSTNFTPRAVELANGKWLFPAYTPESGVELWGWDPVTDAAFLVKDIFRGTVSSNPYNLTVMGSSVYFSALNSYTEGYELWKSDGTAAGTVMLKALTPGAYSEIEFAPLGIVGADLLFAASTPTEGRELWKTDGTPAGTALLKELASGFSSGFGTTLSAAVMGGVLYFRGSDGSAANGEELWQSDGTYSGTFMLKDIQPGTGNSSPLNLTVSGTTLYFFATTTANGYELWKSDGTEGGTSLVVDLNGTTASGISVNAGMVPFGAGSVMFTGAVSPAGIEPYLSDGTPGGTALIKDVNAGAGAGVTDKLVAAGPGLVFFFGITSAEGQELWKTDGTLGGTVLVSDLLAGTGNGALASSGMIAWGGEAYFAGTSATGDYELWKSDGAAPVLVKDIRTGASSSNPQRMQVGSNGVFFWANDGATATEPWFTDGTTPGTALIGDLNRSNNGSNSGYFYPVSTGTQAFFMADDGTTGRELYRTDGTTAGTSLVKDLNPAGSGLDVNYGTNYLKGMNGIMYFPATDGTSGYELWRSDGTSPGTYRVKDINPGSGNGIEGYNQELFMASSGNVFFAADDGLNGRELWVSDGTESGTQMVANLNGLTTIPTFFEYNGFVYFTATIGTDQQLWRTDGTAMNTAFVANVETNPARYDTYGNFCVYDNKLFFSAYTFANGTELYVWDGATVSMVADLYPGTSSGFPNSSNPTGMKEYNGFLWFSATNGSNGYELWKSDGTSIGTQMFIEINPGSNGGFSGSLPVDGMEIVNGKLVFIGYTDAEGEEPWVSDGTVPGTYALTITKPGNFGSTQWSMYSDGNHAFFQSSAPDGSGLWQTDGTPAGTFFVAQGLFPIFHNACMIGSTFVTRGNMFSPLGQELYAYNAFVPVVENAANQTVTADAQFQEGTWTYYYHAASDKVLFAVEPLGERLGYVWEPGFAATVQTLTGLGSGNALAFTNTTGYASNPNWYGMHRHWQLTPGLQPTDSLRVRFFYTDTDLADVQGTLPEINTDAELVFFKLNGVAMPSPYHDHSGIGAANYQQYLNGAQATKTTWKSGTWRGLKYAELVVSSFSGGGGGGGAGGLGAFPVEWLWTEAEARPDGQVDIRWMVADSRTAVRFDVEFSADGRDFAPAATLVPEMAAQQGYATVHAPGATGTLYYRIRQVDTDGTTTLSNTLQVEVLASPAAQWLAPNPATDVVRLPVPVGQPCRIRVLDMTGKEVWEQTQAPLSQAEMPLSVKALAEGVYHVWVSAGADVMHYRLLVKK